LTIGDHAFTYCNNLEKLVIPDSVNSIGVNCFEECYSLKFTKLPSSLKTIKSNSFIDTAFERIEFPDSVEVIESLAFQNNSRLTTLSFGSSLKSIDASAFTYCLNISNITVSEKNELFFATNSILFKRLENGNELVMFPVSLEIDVLQLDQYKVTVIGPYSFSQSCVKSIVGLDSNVISIGQFAFFKSKIETLNIVHCVTKIPEYCFAHSQLKNFIISAPVKEIGKFAFYNCKSLMTVKFNESVKIIRESAFEVTNLQEVLLPGIVDIESNAFANGYINYITFGPDLKRIGDGAFLKLYRITNISLPDGVEELKPNVFYGCNQLANFKCGNIKSIGDRCFAYCHLLKFTIPKSCTSIGTNAFIECYGLTELAFEENISISWGAFANCKITSVTFNDYVLLLSKDAFNNCSRLKTVRFMKDVLLAYTDPFNNTSIESVYYCGTEKFNATSFSSSTQIYVTSDYKGSKFAGKIPKVISKDVCLAPAPQPQPTSTPIPPPTSTPIPPPPTSTPIPPPPTPIPQPPSQSPTPNTPQQTETTPQQTEESNSQSNGKMSPSLRYGLIIGLPILTIIIILVHGVVMWMH